MSALWDETPREALREILPYALKLLDTDMPLGQIGRRADFLAWVARRAHELGGQPGLLALRYAPAFCAQIFTHPGSLGRWAVARRLQAYRDFLLDRLGEEEAERCLADIDQFLIPTGTKSWYRAERRGGGRPDSRRTPRLLFAQQLLASVEKAGAGKRGEQAIRDQALVATCCWSPLWPGEVVGLTWEQIGWGEAEGDSPFTAWVHCTRSQRELILPVHRNAASRLALLHAVVKRSQDRQPTGPVFRSLCQPYDRLTYRQIKDRVDAALASAGLRATRRDLLAAYCYHLKSTYGYQEPDLTVLLGYAEAKTIVSLLESYRAWEADRRADELGGPLP